jgi:hypothetical protein
MKKNVGSLDKTLRIIAALVIFALGYYYQSWWGLVGLLPLLTAFAGVCPAYLPCSISTKKEDVQES